MNNRLNEILEQYNQNELINLVNNKFNDEEVERLESQIEDVNFDQIINLYKNAKEVPEIEESKIEHIEYKDINAFTEEDFLKYKGLGEDIIKEGKYAVITMAGGQGTRLGHKGPKGTFKITTVDGEKCLFQVIVERLLRANEKYNTIIPWYIMTSEENNAQTITHFQENNYFGYPREKIIFFKQGNVPMIRDDGNIVIGQDKLIKFASDGNGSIYKSLKKSNVLEQMKAHGIEWVFVGGVDNILLRVVDPILTGITIAEGNLISSKSVVKKNAKEKVGVFCKLNGVPKVIEYTELPEEMAEELDSNGELVYGEVNILSHLFNIKALERLATVNLPYHTAHKKCNYLDENGEMIEAKNPNAYKFESYIFDGFSFFDDMSILRVKREDEFAPIKNAEGTDSPETAVKLYNDFIERYGKK